MGDRLNLGSYENLLIVSTYHSNTNDRWIVLINTNSMTIIQSVKYTSFNIYSMFLLIEDNLMMPLPLSFTYLQLSVCSINSLDSCTAITFTSETIDGTFFNL